LNIGGTLRSMELPFGSWAVEASGGLRPLPLQTSKIVLAITVKDALRGFLPVAKDQSKRPLRARNKNREFGVMRAVIHRVGPLAGLTVALIATVGWIGLLGYVAIKLF
jgi:hypothetical protein